MEPFAIPALVNIAHFREVDTALVSQFCASGANDKVFATSYESAIREAQFDVLVIPNQGAGAASARIETARRLFPRIFFNADTTEDGRDALGWYHEKKSNDDRNVGARAEPRLELARRGRLRPDVHPLRSSGRGSAAAPALFRKSAQFGRRILAKRLTYKKTALAAGD